jgi:hypothetical protein
VLIPHFALFLPYINLYSGFMSLSFCHDSETKPNSVFAQIKPRLRTTTPTTLRALQVF